MRLLLVSHAADRTGAPISALQLAQAFVGMGVDLRVVLRRDGPLRAEYEATAPTRVFRPAPAFSMTDMAAMAAETDALMALKCLRNPDRPYCLSEVERHDVQQLRDELHAWDPDVVYANTTHCGDVLNALELDAPVVTHVRELAPTIAALDTRRREETLHRSASFIAVSEHAKSDLAARFNLPEERILVEPPAINLPNQVANDVDERLGLRAGTRLIVGVGTVGPRKGADLFFEAAADVLTDTKADLLFAWFGDGEWRGELSERAASQGLSDRLVFPGEWPDLFAVYARAELLLCPSREDAYPRVQIEAGAMGTPSMGFAGTGGGEEFIRDYSAGISLQTVGTASLTAGLRRWLAGEIDIADGLADRVRMRRTAQASAVRIHDALTMIMKEDMHA